MNTTLNTAMFDVIVVGYGPTGLVLASLLGQRGHKVAVVERWPQLYGKPRLTHIDGETARLVSLCSDGQQALRDAWTTPHYYWKNGKGQQLIDVGKGNTKKMLWDDHMSVHQPHIEEAIHERIQSYPNVTLYRGYVAEHLAQSAEVVTLKIHPWAKGGSTSIDSAGNIQISAKYLVGADGSNSFVREQIGVERTDFGFNERWLCVDTEPLRPLPSTFDQTAVQICDPKRGYMFMPIGKKRQRFEFALLKKESTEEMSTPDKAYDLLKQYHGLAREDLSLIRNLVYTFECRLAKQWRVGRVFLAGDAAHTNPPYLGQGACSGMRDAANLAWKFDLVLRGVSTDALLNTYEQERMPHAKQLMLDARGLGMVANTSNPVKATIRDLVFKFKLAPKPQFPHLKTGVLYLKDDAPIGAAGTLPPQGKLTVNQHQMTFDEHIGFHFSLIVHPKAVASYQSSVTVDSQQLMENLKIKIVLLSSGSISDANGIYEDYLNSMNAEVALIRPDFVLYGAFNANELTTVVRHLSTQLKGD